MINTVIEKDIMESTKEEAEASKKLRAERIKLLKEKVEAQGMGGQVQIDDSGIYHLRHVLNVYVMYAWGNERESRVAGHGMTYLSHIEQLR